MWLLPYLLVVCLGIGILVWKSKSAETSLNSGFNVEKLSKVDPKDFGFSKQHGLILWSSNECDGCKQTWVLVKPLESAKVDIAYIAFEDKKELHTKYSIDAVPTCSLVDSEGKVLKNFLGKQCTNDFWEAIHELT